MRASSREIAVVVICTVIFLLLLILVIVILLHQYQKRQLSYQHNLNNLKLDFEKILLKTQIEVQEQTFQHISREIHDNINLSLTLVKLNLNTLEWESSAKMRTSIKSSVEILATAITDLSNLSKSTSTDIIKNLGLLNAIKYEIGRIQTSGKLNIELDIYGEPVFLESEKDLIIFRIIQEAFNNIIKHSFATNVYLKLNYNTDSLGILIEDNGRGFDGDATHLKVGNSNAGLKNMRTRTELFGGTFFMDSHPGKGTKIILKVPYNEQD